MATDSWYISLWRLVSPYRRILTITICANLLVALGLLTAVNIALEAVNDFGTETKVYLQSGVETLALAVYAAASVAQLFKLSKTTKRPAAEES